jgi:NET1-associated nuclear protein 1 (U3 small nucleolar RNA-associated protein 17)
LEKTRQTPVILLSLSIPMTAALSLTPERLNLRSGGNSSTQQFSPTLLYSQDGKYLFQREAHVIRVLNTKNGHALHECIRAEQPLRSPSHGEDQDDETVNVRVDVTALALHPYNALQLIASYADGMLVVWDFIEEKMLQQFDAKARVVWMGASTASPLMLLLVIAGPSAVEKNAKDKPTGDANEPDASDVIHWSVVEFNMKKKRRGRTLLEQNKVPFVAAAMESYVSPTSSTSVTSDESADIFHGDYLVIAAAARLFTVKVTRDLDGGSGMGTPVAVQKLSHLRDVTCVTVNPRVPLEFALGDSIGQIFRYLQNAASTAKMHWHSHAVRSLRYASDGQFLLSGGEENVLVSWHLETGRRAYLPRRSAPLMCITTRVDAGGTGYAISLEDNVLFQYNPITREEEWQSIGLARAGGLASHAAPWKQLIFDPLTHAIALNGVSSAGVLQLYEPYKDRVLHSVVLTERNQVTRTEDEELPQILAEQLAFSANGSELVTVHRPTGTSTGEDQALRFWTRRANGTFFVHTAIDAPHGTACVTSLAFSPSLFAGDGVVVTGDALGEFKVWRKTTIVTAASTSTDPSQPHQQAITNDVSTSVWHCQSVVKFRDMAISTIAFSSDGSLVAVAYGALLTLWDLSTMALRGVLTSADGMAIQQIFFTGKTSPYVAVRTSEQVQVWNLLTMTLWWRYVVPSDGSFVAAGSKDDELLVVIRGDTREYVVMTMAPESPVPVKLQRVVFPDEAAADVWAVAVHPKHGDFVLLDARSNVLRAGEQRVDSKTLRLADQEDDERTPLAAMFQQVRNEFQSKRQATERRAASPDSTAALFDAPAHVLPSMTTLYRSFMDKMLAKPQANGTAAGDDDDELQGKKNRKKATKKRKKTAGGHDLGDQEIVVKAAEPQESEDATQKRVKAMVEKELANAAQQKHAYSAMLAGFRKHKKSKGSKA